MKKLMTMLLALCMTVSLLAGAAGAYTQPQQNAADALNSLSLFLGTDKGYELDSKLDRSQSVMLLVRMLGKLDMAEKDTSANPFNDVPKWADRVVTYAYANGLVKGYDAATFGGSDAVSDYQYLTMVLRALGYTDSGDKPDFNWRESRKLAKELGLVSSAEDDQSFDRGSAVEIFWNAMNTKCKGSDQTLSARLIAQGVFTEAQFAAASDIAKNGVKQNSTTPGNTGNSGNTGSSGNSGSNGGNTGDNGSTGDNNNGGSTGDNGNTGDNNNSGGNTGTGEKKPQDYTWEEYEALEDKDAFIDSFDSLEDFMAWQREAKAKYDEKKNIVEPGSDGSVDIGDLKNGSK